MSTVVPETGEVILPPDDMRLSWEPMTLDAARQITADIKAYATRLCHLVRDAKTGQAWTPLGYDTWAEYVETEFGMSRQRAQQLIDHANKLDVLAEVVELAAPPVAQVPERATRGLKSDDLRAALVAAMEESPAELTEAERLSVANKAIDTLRKAKAAASTAVDALSAHQDTNKKAGGDDGADPAGDADPNEGGDGASGHDAGHSAPEPPAAFSGEDSPPAPSPEPGQVSPPAPAPSTGEAGADTPSDTAAPGDTGTTRPGESDEGVPGDRLTPSSPALPADWSDRLACATYLLGCPVELLRERLSDDDRIDLRDLRTYIDQLLEEQP